MIHPMQFPQPPARYVAFRAAAHDGEPIEAALCEQASFWTEGDALDWQNARPATGPDISSTVTVLTARATGRVLAVWSTFGDHHALIGGDGTGNTLYRILRDRSHNEPPPIADYLKPLKPLKPKG